LPIGSPIAVFGQPGEDAKAALAKGGGAAKPEPAAKPQAAQDQAAQDQAAQDQAAPDPAARASQPGADEEPAPKRVHGDVSAPVEPAVAHATGRVAESAPADKPAVAERSPVRAAAQSVEQAQSTRGPSKQSVERGTPSTGNGQSRTENGRVPASPLARRIAHEHGVPLGAIEGSGPHGRVVKTDVEKAVAAKGVAMPAARPAVDAPQRADKPLQLSQMRKAIARRMTQANAEIPHFYLGIVVDMDNVAAMREQLGAALPDAKISYNDFVVLACARALVAHPEINAFWNGETIVVRGEVHVGIAVAVEDGLVVPVIRNTDRRSLREIAAMARDLGTRARSKKLAPPEMSGSTFSVSNLGMFGIEEFAAVVNPGEGAILAIGAIVEEPVAKNGELTIGKRMRVTLSCDHRVMDGATAARFLGTLRQLLEHPLAMLA
jgi:pyruvate dehydrogenase E2 component (dihydrolipoamide acetyltransferase)